MLRAGIVFIGCTLATGLSGCGLYQDVQSMVGKPRAQSDLQYKNPPLSLPPDYALRPPTGTAKRAGADSAERKARTVLKADTVPAAAPAAPRLGDRSAGESALLKQAGMRPDTTNVVKRVVDLEGQRAKDAEKNFVNKLVKYKEGKESPDNKDEKSARDGTPDKPVIKRDGEL